VRDGALLASRGAPLFRTVQRLPALLDLDVDTEGQVYAAVSAGNGLPRCEELALLHSRSLTRLSVSWLEGPEEGASLRLHVLPELRSCELVGSAFADGCVRIDPVSFRGVPQLENLYLDNLWDLDLQDGSLAQLTALTSLSMVNCALKKVPADVVLFAGTLCQLDLSSNEDLQVDSAASACIVQCRNLRLLSLWKPDIHEWADYYDDGFEQQMARVGYAPSLWSSESVRQLALLPCTFLKQHGRDLNLRC